MDVDKWDYFLRDSQATGVEVGKTEMMIKITVKLKEFCCMQVVFKYGRILRNIMIQDYQSEEYNCVIKRIAIRKKEDDMCQVHQFLLHKPINN